MHIRHLFAIGLLIALVGFVTSQLPTSVSSAEQVGGAIVQKRCVGITSSILRTQNPVITRIYRVFEDGGVETYDDGAPGAKWTLLGK